MAIADAGGLPAAARLASASQHEVKLAEAAPGSLFLKEMPEKLVGGKACDSGQPDENLLEKHGVELIAPHRRRRTRPKTQDRRKLRRYKRRWKAERLFAWLQNVRRLAVRHERHADNFLSFLLLACSVVLLRFFEISSSQDGGISPRKRNDTSATARYDFCESALHEPDRSFFLTTLQAAGY